MKIHHRFKNAPFGIVGNDLRFPMSNSFESRMQRCFMRLILKFCRYSRSMMTCAHSTNVVNKKLNCLNAISSFQTVIPLAKLRAMVTMAKYKDSSFQSFKLPLSPVNIPSDEVIDNDDAALNVTINYQQRQIFPQSIASIESKSPCICLSVSILRACGLKVGLFLYCH